MCGIIGLVAAQDNTKEVFLASRDRLRHRGPDDEGYWASEKSNVLLGHRRLSILDLSDSGHQPMVSRCGRYVIVFNGEVYNYLELRDELEEKGHGFTGTSDTEVVLAAYAEWGDACLSRFNGMFAMAVYDRGRAGVPAGLFLARDRAGKKPLYYAHRDNTLAFASELKAIPAPYRGGLDLNALNFYLALGYVPGSLCIAEGVNKLPPGHCALYRMDTGELKTWRWWSLPALAPVSPIDVESLTDEAETLLHDAVRIRLRSDVPVGVLLSGGLDSSLVVASAVKASAQTIKTFTMGLPGSNLDETSYAGIVARHFATDHHILEVPEPSLTVLDEIAPFIDEPIADSSLIPAYMVSKLTAQHVKVALGGDGGDELFGGYGNYTAALADQARFGWLPDGVFRLGAVIAGLIPPGIPGRNRISALRGGPLQSLVWSNPYFDAAARRRILSPDAVAALGDDLIAPERFIMDLFLTGRDPVDCMTRTHFGGVLPDDYLVKIDRVSMSVSLEMRCPLLDKRLVEFAFGSLPSEWKVLGTESRRLQRRLGRRMLPPELDIDRKQGFSIPLDDWLRGADRGRLDGLDSRLPGWINRKEVNDLTAGHQRGRTNGSRLFALMMLDIAIKNLFKG